MKLISHLIQRRLQLPPPLTRDVVVHRDLRVPMPDGVDLLADRWAPRSGDEGLPTALIRCPYGRSGPIGTLMARPLAERGFQVLLQSVRGTFGSGGVFDPMRQERDDGLATLDWLVRQPWSGDAIVLYGMSYMGHVQWAVADRLPPEVKALIPVVTESALTLEFLRGDGMSLETPFGWGALVTTLERPLAMLRQPLQSRKTARALWTLPLNRADHAACGTVSPYIQDILTRDADDSRWQGFDHRDRVAKASAPVCSIGGWYDIFLPGQLHDFKLLQQAGHPARLIIGPWTHTRFGPEPVREAIEFGLSHARGEQPPPRPPVRLYVMGQETWRDFESWPPQGYTPERFHLHPDGTLSTEPPAVSTATHYRYDPSHPTPAVGGVRMVRNSGRVDNTALEARSDVVAYTTPVLGEDIEVIGEVSAEVWFCSTLPHADVFVRLCDVDPAGRSWNICDGLLSLTDADQPQCAEVRLWPTAHRFKRGHRIRVQISSGAFPRYARNPGTGEPLATATTLRPAHQTVRQGPAHPSAIILPVRTQRTASATD
ncbi:CocE/NonD family hydrolase [Streptomyces sp. NPDC047061]|uniref:CocE/NonD family hydrolase n=1 Tax=Streptomyces sp. NPDC047061 TaxID=3154605 RepID=UPI00340F80C9